MSQFLKTLDDIESLLNAASQPSDVFANEAEYKRLLASTHPDRFESGSDQQRRAESLFKRLGEWHEWNENPPEVNGYVLREKIGSGDVCDVFKASKSGELFVLKQPRTASCNNLLAKEMECLRQLQEQSNGDTFSHYFPNPVETFESSGKRHNVFTWVDGLCTVDEILKVHPFGVDGRHIGWMFKRLLTAIGYAHTKEWINCGITPQHVLFNADNHGAMLLGWIHATQPNHECRIVSKKYRGWYPDEILKAKKPLPASDVYMAAKLMIHLAGGMQHMPDPMRSFMKGCLLQSPAMRGGDAWEIHDQFDSLLFELYGPPRFVPLDLRKG